MKVKVVTKFIDKHTAVVHKVGEIFECTEERYAEILAKGYFVEAIAEEEKAEENKSKSLEEMTFAEVKKVAKSKGLNIDGLNKKADIIAVIKAAE